MWKNYLTVALRNLLRYRRFAVVNLLGLSVGLAVLILTQTVVDHETRYDSFFPDHERIYAVYGDLRPEAGYGVRTMDGVHRAVRPLLDQYVPEIEASARSLVSERVLRAGDSDPFYQQVRFVDPGFLAIFAFDYVDGDGVGALAEPNSVILSETAARRYFDTEDAVGRMLTIDNKLDVRVTAVIRDLPANSHFTTSLLPPGLFDPKFEMLASMDTWRSLGFGEPDRDWGNINPWDPTYVLLREGADRAKAEEGLARLYDEHFDGDARRNIAGLGLRPLVELSQYLWNATGIPVPQSVRILGFLVLGIAILNYAILANAQTMARTREIALRKILGAGRSQLAFQFLFESVLLSALALIPALALLELALPWIGSALGQDIRLLGEDVAGRAALIGGTTLATGLLAGLYPALRIARMPSLAETTGLGRAGRLTRIVVGLQFLAASVLGGLVLVIHAQNAHMRAAAGATFDNDRILALERIQSLGAIERLETLKRELLAIPDVESAAYVSQLPYMQGNRSEPYARAQGDKASAVTLLQLRGDHDFLRMLQIPILAGRDFSAAIANDRLAVGDTGAAQEEVNVILNETAVRQLGWASPNDAIGEAIWFVDADESARAHRIVGVAADVNYLGLHNRIWPTIFEVRPEWANFLALQLREGASAGVGEAIDEAWRRLAPETPVLRTPLSVYFEELMAIFNGIGRVLAPLAAIAAALAFFGLFGLAAYATERRKREIGIRKVLGAGTVRIVRLVIWQMSRPVMAALVIAMPLAWLAADFYLRFFSDRLAGMPLYLAAAAMAALGVAATAIATHAIGLARTHPTLALREE